MTKELSVAFIWHMHQPIYKCPQTGEYLMPWVRLHAIKDYLDMLLLVEEYPNIKQTFNFVPSLLDQLIDYGNNNAQDIHMKLTLKDVNDLNTEDKSFILDHFFDANYPNMIAPHEPYKKLYDKRYQQKKNITESFSSQEYSDILAWFNLVWFDPYWFSENEELKKLYEKGYDYTLEDRKRIIEIQQELIRRIIPKYKEALEKGQIELSISPYYHPIMPILINSSSTRKALPNIKLPESEIKFYEDAKTQVFKSIERFKEIFGTMPDGIWPSEHCISNETLELMSSLGIKWTITDEGNLAKTIGKEFIRDFHGNLEDPYDLSKVYKSEIDNIYILFRNSVLSDLIGFEYGAHDHEIAANDLYERIKNIQAKLENTPEKNHIVTIALDGENCWESYAEDGRLFLNQLYKLLSEDKSLNITTVKAFINKVKNPSTIKDIHSGSWINRNFEIWIGDQIKNLAWDYLSRVRNDLINILIEKDYHKETITEAWEELYIAEGSDWFWWYGEPNDSGQDDLFDKLFRKHLQSIYNILDKPVPEYLNSPLDLLTGKSLRSPQGILKTALNGQIDLDEWKEAGCVEIPEGPMYQSDKLMKRIFFGYDTDNMYFKFDINTFDSTKIFNEIYIYCYIPESIKSLSPVRIRNKGANLFSTQKYGYPYEIEIPLYRINLSPIILSEAVENVLWKVKKAYKLTQNLINSIELTVPFGDIDVQPGQEVHFVVITSKSQIIQEVIPQNKALSINRPNIID